jgi:hypothetical protein
MESRFHSVNRQPATPSWITLVHSLLTTVKRRRQFFIALIVCLIGWIGHLWWIGVPTLSAQERILVGVWRHPQVYSPMDFGVLAGPMTNPCHVMEFCRDRTFRFFYASADDANRRYLVVEGRWSVEGGKLCLEDMPRSARRITAEIGSRIESLTGRSLQKLRLYAPMRIKATTRRPFRLDGREVLAYPIDGESWIWNRFPGWDERTSDRSDP